ncbi:MAG: hypothetical protein KKF27_20670 [Gammaproteobacteria bacterium]|nr:hypothetical protein [Gammaproteobacteria bacterium]
MITDIFLENFQRHLETHLELHEGVNVIKGTSHKGKSSIARGIEWNVLNQPLGDVYGTWLKKEGTPYSVSIQTSEEKFVTRERSSSFNGYTTENDSFEALRGDVPQEVKDILQLSEINIQSQENNHFLISDKPSDVAKKLNEVAGLEIIHKSLSKADSILRDARKGAKLLDEQIEREKEGLKKYDFLNKIEPFILRIETALKEKDLTNNKQRILKNILSNIGDAREKLENYQDFLTVKKSYKDLITKIQKSKETTIKRGLLETCQYTINELRQKKAEHAVVIEAKPQVKNLKKKLEQYRQISTRINDLKKAISDIAKLKIINSELNSKARDARIEYNTTLKSCKTCPLCHQKILT